MDKWTAEKYNRHYIPLVITWGYPTAKSLCVALDNHFQCKRHFQFLQQDKDANYIYCQEKLTIREIEDVITFAAGFDAGRRSY